VSHRSQRSAAAERARCSLGAVASRLGAGLAAAAAAWGGWGTRPRGAPANVVPLGSGRVTLAQAQHVGRRREQQDAVALAGPAGPAAARSLGAVAVVADGMGGLEMGAEASRTAVAVFLDTLRAAAARGDAPVPALLEEAIVAANDAVARLAGAAGIPGEIGTTLAAAVVGPDGLHWISAGDSRVYVWRAGRLTQLTTDHVYARRLAEDVARGRATPSELALHPHPNALTSWLGEPALGEVDRSVAPHPLLHDDVVVVCTDGVYNALAAPELAALIAPGAASADAVAGAVLRRRRPNQDNLTIVTLSYARLLS